MWFIAVRGGDKIMRIGNALILAASTLVTVAFMQSGPSLVLGQTKTTTPQPNKTATSEAKSLNDQAVAAFMEAYGQSSTDKKAISKVAQSEQLLQQSLSAAKSTGDVCMEATVMRNLAGLYETSTYQGYLEETAGVAKSTTALKTKTDSVKNAWSDPRFANCKKSVAKRISLYGPALDDGQIDTFENFYQELRSAVKRGDKNATASLFDFPMNIRGSKKRTVRTKAEFIRSYDSIITPAVVKALATTSPAQLWGRDQGICVGSGILWLNANMEKPNRFVITSVNG